MSAIINTIYVFSLSGFIHDVSVKKIAPDTIDDNEDKFRDIVRSPEGIKAIQVKRTAITSSVAKQILLNWILLEGSNEIITDYIVFSDSSYENSDNIFNISKEELYSYIIKSSKSSKSTIAKVKKKYKNEKQNFIDIYESIKSKYSFRSINDLDDEIDENCKVIFKKAGVNSITYYNRIQELLRHITFEIIKRVNEKKPFEISYKELMIYSEDICERFTDKYIYPIYSEFKKVNKIDFTDLKIAESREYKQLLACSMQQKMIETHLLYSIYYQNVCYKFLELNKINKIQDIEETTFENFEYAKFIVQDEGRDTPAQRLKETKKQPNSHADSDQIRYGSGIYLTREDESEHQISWEDEDNAKPEIRSGNTSN